MRGNMSQDLSIPGASKMGDFGASFLYREDIARAGQIMPQNLAAARNTSQVNIYNQQRVQFATQLPPSNTTPLSSIKSHYAMLPIGQANKAGR